MRVSKDLILEGLRKGVLKDDSMVNEARGSSSLDKHLGVITDCVKSLKVYERKFYAAESDGGDTGYMGLMLSNMRESYTRLEKSVQEIETVLDHLEDLVD